MKRVIYKDLNFTVSEETFEEWRKAHAQHLAHGGKKEFNDFITYLIELGWRAMHTKSEDDGGLV